MQAEDVERSEWAELGQILRGVAPVAFAGLGVIVGWELSGSGTSASPMAATGTALAFALTSGFFLFAPQRFVGPVLRVAAASMGLLTIGVVVAGTAYFVYVGIAATVTFVGQHLWTIATVLIVLFFIAAMGSSAGTKPASRHDKNERPLSRSSPENKTQRRRRRWSIEVRRRVWMQYSKKCYYCDIDLPSWRGQHMHLDHVVPLARGGADSEGNLRPACPDCNLEKGKTHYPEVASAVSGGG